MSTTFQFERLTPARPWNGRYCRIPAKSSVFRTRADDRIEVYWEKPGTGLWITAPAIMTPDANAMAEAINAFKFAKTGIGGGSFLINEWGQVIVTNGNSSNDRGWVGNVAGCLEFFDAHAEKTFDLSGADLDRPGSPWPLPYIGMKFKLSNFDQVAYTEEKDGWKRDVTLRTTPRNLVAALRKVRKHGPLRFIVNPHGVVLTKIETITGWNPVFVTKLDLSEWFTKES